MNAARPRKSSWPISCNVVSYVMFIIQRRVGQRIVVTGGIEIVVTAVQRRGVRLGVTAPQGIAVLRGEVYDAVVAANAAATQSERPDDPEDPEGDH